MNYRLLTCVALIAIAPGIAHAGVGGLVGWAEKLWAGCAVKVAAPSELSEDAIEAAVREVIDDSSRLQAVSTAGISAPSRERFTRAVEAELLATGDFVQFEASGKDTDAKFERLAEVLRAQFSDVDFSRADRARLPAGIQMSRMLDAVVGARGFSRQQRPLTILIRDFEPISDSWEPLSSWARAVYNDVSDDSSLALRLIIVSPVDMSEWGAAQGHMNVGNHVHLRDFPKAPFELRDGQK